jgi:SAM-dependent methyltransferase
VSELLEFAVLRSRAEIDTAWAELRRRRLAATPSRYDRAASVMLRVVRRRHLKAGLLVDPLKGWDVLRAISAIEHRVWRDEAVLDMGTFASALPPALSKLGYCAVNGIDLNPAVLRMSGGPGTNYVMGDLTQTSWPDAHFAAITAISVIEHGVPVDALLQEVARLLRTGGIFIFSTDYWPEKQESAGKELFGLPWTIYSADEIRVFIRRAADFGLAPVKDPQAVLLAVADRPISFNGLDYTFLYGAFVKGELTYSRERAAQRPCASTSPSGGDSSTI